MADPEGRPARPRAERGRPMVQDRHRCRCRDMQSLLERRLRWVARRAARGGTPRLKDKLARDIETFGDDYPHVLHMHSYEERASYLNMQADLEAQRTRAARIRRWKTDIQEDVSAMAKWITAHDTTAASSPKQLGEPATPVVSNGLKPPSGFASTRPARHSLDDKLPNLGQSLEKTLGLAWRVSVQSHTPVPRSTILTQVTEEGLQQVHVDGLGLAAKLAQCLGKSLGLRACAPS